MCVIAAVLPPEVPNARPPSPSHFSACRPAHAHGARAVTVDQKASRDRLSPERERALVSAAASGDQAARDQLVESFTPLIASVARTYRGTSFFGFADMGS